MGSEGDGSLVTLDGDDFSAFRTLNPKFFNHTLSQEIIALRASVCFEFLLIGVFRFVCHSLSISDTGEGVNFIN